MNLVFKVSLFRVVTLTDTHTHIHTSVSRNSWHAAMPHRCTDVLFLFAPVDKVPLCPSGDCLPCPYQMHILKIRHTNLHTPFIGTVPQTTRPFLHPLICIVDLYWHSDSTITLNDQDVNPKFSGIKLHIISQRYPENYNYN